jgi:alpha-beta hydrolase superfamily lysophospholipase
MVAHRRTGIAPEITVPLLLLSAPDEKLVPPEGGRMIYERASSAADPRGSRSW